MGATTGWAEGGHDEVDYHVAPRLSSGGALARRMAIPSLQAAVWSSALRAASGEAVVVIQPLLEVHDGCCLHHSG